MAKRINVMNSAKIKLNQNGFASMVIALILILLMSLMTIAFSQLSRREQKSSLDKQLATQAYYAAETGINDARSKIVNPFAQMSLSDQTATANDLDTKKCLTPIQLNKYGLKTDVDSSRGISYSCVILDLTPKTLDYTNVNVGNERFSSFSTSGGLSSLTVSWSSTEPGRNTLRTSGGFPNFNSWQAPAVLQVIFTPIGGGSQAELENNTFTAYFYPVSSATNPNPAQAKNSVAFDVSNSDNQAKIIYTDCPDDPDTTKPLCKATITGVGGGSTTDQYLIRVKPFYTKSNITIGDAKDGGNLPLDFVNAQAKIDVTGRARDVLKRVKVSSPINQTSSSTTDAVEAQNMCKRILTAPDKSAASSFAGAPAGACDFN